MTSSRLVLLAGSGPSWKPSGTYSISGPVENKSPLGGQATFPTDPYMGRVVRIPGSITGNFHIAPMNYLPNVAGKTYRATIKARHNSAFVGDSANALIYLVRKYDKDFASVADIRAAALTFPAPNSIRTFQVEWTSDGSSGAPYILPFAYVSGSRTSASMSIDIQSIEVVDITGAAEVAANLSNNYLTSAQTNAAIAAVQTSLSGQINSGDTALQSNINSILGLTISPSSALATTLTNLQSTVGSQSASISAQGAALATLQGNASASYVLRAKAGGASALLELVAADNPNGPVSVFRVAATDILLDGSVAARQFVVTDFSGNLVFNGALPYGDTRGWGPLPDSFSIVARDPASTAAVLQTAPTGYILRLATDAAPQVVEIGRFDCSAGERFVASYSCAGNSGSNAQIGIQYVWFDADGAVVANTGRYTTVTTGAWQSVTTPAATAPAGAAKCVLRAVRIGGGAGFGFLTNMEVVKQRSGQTLVTPNSLTTELVNTEDFSAKGLAVFGGALQSDNFNAATGTGWQLTKAGGLKIPYLSVSTPILAPNAISRMVSVASSEVVAPGTGLGKWNRQYPPNAIPSGRPGPVDETRSGYADYLTATISAPYTYDLYFWISATAGDVVAAIFRNAQTSQYNGWAHRTVLDSHTGDSYNSGAIMGVIPGVSGTQSLTLAFAGISGSSWTSVANATITLMAVMK
ncbi:hypothetical protein J5260_05875 [Luteovulum azotoformans]|nr:hypothetical protein [Cereibacter azotoformans]